MAPPYSELVELLLDGARYGDVDDVQSALEQGADVNAQDDQGRTALHMAAANGHVELLQTLLDTGANFALANADGNTPLHWACLNGQTGAVRALLQAGASASALNHHDATPMDAALSRDFQEVVDVINEFNAPSKEVEDVEVPDDAEEVTMGEADMEPAAEGAASERQGSDRP